MEDFYKISFDRLSTLLKECDELEAKRKEVTTELDAKEKVANNLLSYLKAELRLQNDVELLDKLDRVLRRAENNESEIDKRVDDKHEDFSLTPSNHNGAKFNKTHFIIKLMHGLNSDGATPSQIFELTQNTEKKDEFSLAYTNNVLGKLKVRKLVENKNGDYYLTDEGVKFAETIK